jgi:hypothetical protein
MSMQHTANFLNMCMSPRGDHKFWFVLMRVLCIHVHAACQAYLGKQSYGCALQLDAIEACTHVRLAVRGIGSGKVRFFVHCRSVWFEAYLHACIATYRSDKSLTYQYAICEPIGGLSESATGRES